ncbi:hypothetical protein BG011_008799 [Mortierella polycephala]|uniref:Uncharacterized protein n=1 Tax=Mortierella polycephala TaxID=41804 RepID=A0A9P6PP76_9FUNG|nr:hypothetical protein BG011_008799 [Mortierella polycephala]
MFLPTFTPHSPQPQAQIPPYSPQNQTWYTQNGTAVMVPLSSPIPSSQQQYQPHNHHNQPNHPQSEVYLQQGLNSHQQDYPQEQQHHHHHQSHPLHLQQQHHILSPQHYQHNSPLQCISHPYVQPVLITPEPREGSYPTPEFLSPQQGVNAPSPLLQDTPSSDHTRFISQVSTPSMAHVPAGTMPWDTIVDFDTKDLFDPSAEALRLNPVVINPAQLCTPPRVHVLEGGDIDGRGNNGMYVYSHDRNYDDNDSVDGTDDDADARRHLSDSSYLSSTPPLSPNILDHHQHSQLMQILTGLNASTTVPPRNARAQAVKTDV